MAYSKETIKMFLGMRKSIESGDFKTMQRFNDELDYAICVMELRNLESRLERLKKRLYRFDTVKDKSDEELRDKPDTVKNKFDTEIKNTTDKIGEIKKQIDETRTDTAHMNKYYMEELIRNKDFIKSRLVSLDPVKLALNAKQEELNMKQKALDAKIKKEQILQTCMKYLYDKSEGFDFCADDDKIIMQAYIHYYRSVCKHDIDFSKKESSAFCGLQSEDTNCCDQKIKDYGYKRCCGSVYNWFVYESEFKSFSMESKTCICTHGRIYRG